MIISLIMLNGIDERQRKGPARALRTLEQLNDRLVSAPESPITQLLILFDLRQPLSIDNRGAARGCRAGKAVRQRQALAGVIAYDDIIRAVIKLPQQSLNCRQ